MKTIKIAFLLSLTLLTKPIALAMESNSEQKLMSGSEHPGADITPLDFPESLEGLSLNTITEMGENLLTLSLSSSEHLQDLSEEEISEMQEEGIKLLQWAADQDHIPAHQILGYYYSHADSLNRDLVNGEKHLQIAADQGDSIAQYHLALLHFRGYLPYSDQIKAVDNLKKAAAQGHREALYTLGRLYEQSNNNIISQDLAAAATCYQQAAAQGLADAQLALGRCYLRGRGVAHSEQKAVEWMTQAAENGLPFAYTVLGKAYNTGDGLPLDQEKSSKYIKFASDLGDPCGQTALAIFILNKSPLSQEDKGEAFKLLSAAALKEIKPALETLALFPLLSRD
ncbi:tetratricopeptide repeat protein [Candidatus Odyssella thessalonicensis]|uniref:tetratricopeptide repeat protein n=1 Tax=Candidatus Odyssella thessalonicensis TaxID=84647 RepID=UPI000225AF5E|nr:tetratricopeptide repeat protein [Candidatus Odyssella thessalonicensis]